ncbi:MAG TPA: polysaccharide biosynthesis tyrosine autokinase [Longimicrobiaceae bacterium]|nr:polysaccharide biosynthesis tyrosine autokinase [Longimicrobiaceae bacterium]
MMSHLSSPPEKHLYLPAGAGRTEAEEEGTNLAEYLGALRRRSGVVLLVTTLGVLMAVYKVMTTERLYSSTAVIEIAGESSSPTGGLAGLAASLGAGGTLDSHVEIIRSRGLLGQVVDSLGLRLERRVPNLWRSTPEPTGIVDAVRIAPNATTDALELQFTEQGVRVKSGSAETSAAYGEPLQIRGVGFVVPEQPAVEEVSLWVVPKKVAVDRLIEHVRAYPRQRTNIVDVVVTGYDPVITERVANITAELYQRYSTRRSREEAERRRRFVEEQLVKGEALLRGAQNRLTEHRRRERLYSTRAELMAGQSERKEIDLQRSELDAERRMYRSLLSQLQRPGHNQDNVIRTIVSSPGISANQTVYGMYERLARHEAARDSLTSGPWRRSVENPDVQRVDSLISISRERLLGATRSHIEWLDARIQGLDAITARSDTSMQRLAGAEPEELRLMLEVESYGDAVKTLREKYYSVGIVEAAGEEKISFLDNALPGMPAGSGPVHSLLFGFVFSLMIGCGGAIALDSLSRSIRKRGELERILRVPELGVIPRVRLGSPAQRMLRLPGRFGNGRSGRGSGPELLTVMQLYSDGAEAYRTLRTNLVFAQNSHPLRSVVITSPSGSEGKTTTAANLAVTFAQQGMRVLLVDCDFYHARLHRTFDVPRGPGLSELLLGTVAVEQTIRKTEIERVSLIPAGPLPPVNPADLLGGDVVRSLIQSLSEEFDFIVFDAPPVLTTAHATVLATQADGALLVTRAGQTDRDSARDAVQQLLAVGARVLGTVLNDPDATISQRRGYYGAGTVVRA